MEDTATKKSALSSTRNGAQQQQQRGHADTACHCHPAPLALDTPPTRRDCTRATAARFCRWCRSSDGETADEKKSSSVWVLGWRFGARAKLATSARVQSRNSRADLTKLLKPALRRRPVHPTGWVSRHADVGAALLPQEGSGSRQSVHAALAADVGAISE
eukprot:scaffold18750_cov113-Isochrysis_galbana.AAC.1